MSLALVTGASRGGGRGIALADRVDELVLTARSGTAPPAAGMSGTLAEVAAELDGRRARVHVGPADLTDPAAVGSIVSTVEDLGGCDLLVANAAYNPAGAFELAGTGVDVTCVRVDEALRSESLAGMFPELDTGAGGCTPEEFGTAVARVAATPGLSGRVLTFTDLRGLGALASPDISSVTEGAP